MLTINRRRASIPAIDARRLAALPGAVSTVTAQAPPADAARIEAGTEIAVMTEPIDAQSRDGRVYSAVVDRDVLESSTGRVAIPAGSAVELEARDVRDGDLILDLDSVTVNGRRYGVRAAAERMDTSQGGVDRDKAAKYIGGGALLGTIIGAVTGGGKGAAIGAAAGAAAGAGAVYATRGRRIRVPDEAVVTFRLERPLDVDVPDDGYMRDRYHYHPIPPKERTRDFTHPQRCRVGGLRPRSTQSSLGIAALFVLAPLLLVAFGERRPKPAPLNKARGRIIRAAQV
jgi:hypothetical protein